MTETLLKITQEHVDIGMLTKSAQYAFVVEASTLGCPPGMWPNRIETSLGNGNAFLIKDDRKEEVKIYKQEFGCLELHVLND